MHERVWEFPFAPVDFPVGSKNAIYKSRLPNRVIVYTQHLTIKATTLVPKWIYISWHHMTNHVSSRRRRTKTQRQRQRDKAIRRRLRHGARKSSRTEFDRLANARSPSGYPPRVMGVPCAAGPARRAPTNGARAVASSPGFFLHTKHGQSGLQCEKRIGL